MTPKRINPDIKEIVEEYKIILRIFGNTALKLPFLLDGLITIMTIKIKFHHKKEDIKWIMLTNT
ncbi:MAG: hypothetical protein M3162_03095 [Thermoproteota archaeon]|nr:hypothetical protein [Thermoproteota archaeon]